MEILSINRSRRLITPQMVVGYKTRVPVLGGGKEDYVNLDNAASTPPFAEVQRKVNSFMEWYSNVHRGMGFKSQLATQVYENARQVVADFVGADTSYNSVIFVSNTTEAINKVAQRMEFGPEEIVLTTLMEHHSNDLPWRSRVRVLHGEVNDKGNLDLEDMENKLARHKGKVKLVAVTGASNVTGQLNDIYTLAEMAHRYGAKILVDAAQLVPHRPINMLPTENPGHLDFLAFSGHKIYAPYGAGVLIGPTEVFERGKPERTGGGTIKLVTTEGVLWADPPHKEEAGTPNLPGVVALATALKILQQLGMSQVVTHEKWLTAYAIKELCLIPGLSVFGPVGAGESDQRVGVISFSLSGVEPALVASILSHEGAVGVRHGCFCAQPYVMSLLQLSRGEKSDLWNKVAAGIEANKPGLVRVSLGLYNTVEDVKRLVNWLRIIAEGKYKGNYQYIPKEGCYLPKGFNPNHRHYFSL